MVDYEPLYRMLEAAITQAPVIGVLIWYVVTLRNENRELRNLLFDLVLPEAIIAKNVARSVASANGD